MLMIPWGILAQDDLCPEPYPKVEIPEISLDLNGDGVVEVQSEGMTVGTDDVPSSSGQHIWYLNTEPHCSLLYTEDPWSYQTQLLSLPDCGEIPQVRPGHCYWRKEAMIELSSRGYGSAASDWEPIHPFGQRPNCVAVRFTVNERIYVGTIAWRLVEGTNEFEFLQTSIRLEDP